MIVKLKRKPLLNCVSSVARVVNPKAENPVLTTVKVEGRQGGKVLTTAVSTEVWSVKKFINEGAIDTPFTFCVNPKDFCQMLSAINDENIEIDIKDTTLEIIHNKGTFNISYLPDDDFPKTEREKDAATISKNTEELLSWMKEASLFVSTDQIRPILEGIYIYCTPEKFGVAATNAHILYHNYESGTEDVDSEVSGVINGNAITSVLSLLSNAETVNISFGAKRICFATSDSMVSCAIPVGKFPNFEPLIKKTDAEKTHITVNTKDFKDTVSRASLAADKSSGLLILSTKDNILTVQGEDLKASKSSRNTIECTLDGEDMRFGLKGSNMSISLVPVSSVNTTIDVESPKKAIFIIDEDAPNKSIMIMPCVVN